MAHITIPDYCPKCGSRVGPYMGEVNGCPLCPIVRFPYDHLVRVGRYESPLKEMILNFKYHYDQRLDKTLGSLLADAIQGQSWHHEIDALVPVPTAWFWRLKYRCFPVGLLANRAGKMLSLPAFDLLKVKGKKQRQMELPHSQRSANVRGVFRLAKYAKVSGKSLCIIDDVTTTGATLQEVANTLKTAGAKSVYAAVLAKTDPPLTNK